MEPGGRLPVLALAALLAGSTPVTAGVLLTEQQALRRAFGDAPVDRRVLYLTGEQVAAVQARARSKVPSPIVSMYESRDASGHVQRAYVDTHVVRTMPETVMTVVDASGRMRLALVLQFNEPPDYLPRDRWLQAIPRTGLDDQLWPGRGVPRVTGATLTVQALTDAVRRALAIDEIVVRAPRTP